MLFSLLDKVRVSEPATIAPLIVTFSADPATTAERGHLQGTVEGAAMESAPANTQKLDRNVTEPSTDVFLTSPILR